MKSIGCLICFLVLLALGVGCGGSGDDTGVPTISDPTSEPDTRVITIGNLSDKTGASSNAMKIIDMALVDTVDYYNAHELIPGVKVKVVEYDGQYNPANYIPGYEWLKEKGSDLIFTGVPAVPDTIKPRCDNDEMVLFGAAAGEEGFLPPGYTFCGSVLPNHQAFTFLKWIAENDPDFPQDRPAKIGAAGWTSPLLEKYIEGIEEYAEAHPDQYEWVGGYVTDFAFTWGAEVQALNGCDYVYPPMAPLVTFAREYRDAGYTAKFIGGDPHAAFMGLIRDADVWDELDGMWLARESRWWNETGQLIDLTKQLLYEKHADSAEAIIKSGCAYIAVSNAYQTLEIIKSAVEAVGAENFDSQALYEAANSAVLSVDDYQYSYSENKRFAVDYIGIYELCAEGEDLFRVDAQWYPVRYEP